MKRLLILLLLAVLMCFGFTAAEGETLALTAETDMISEGGTLQTVLTRDDALADGELTYTSSDARVATVDANGLVTGIKKGKVTITAIVKTAKKAWRAALKVTVIRPVTEVSIKTDRLPVFAPADPLVAPLLTGREDREENELPVLMIPVNKKIQLTVTAGPRDASNLRTELNGSNPEIFTVRGNIVSGVAPGEGILTAASVQNPEVATRLRVLVIQPVKKLEIQSSAPSVRVGSQITVASSAAPANATLPAVTWSSGDKRILTVDENGVVTGLARGNGRVIATAVDGSNVRANYAVKVVQAPEKVTLSASEVTIDIGRNTAVRATVEPRNTDNKRVIWTSSDESVATVSRDGRITAHALGECVVTCASEEEPSVFSSVQVHTQQPVRALAFNDKLALVYAGETTQLTWNVQPANATNQTLKFSSASQKIATVDENGVVTGQKAGKTTITAVTTDGSNRRARITVQVGDHVRGVSMIRRHAYIDVGETASAGAKLEPSTAINDHMSWTSSNEGVVTVEGSTTRSKLTGMREGNAVVTGTTEDGGYQTSIQVTVGNFDRGLKLLDRNFDNYGEQFWLTVRNDTDVVITSITAELEMFNRKTPVTINTKDEKNPNKVQIVWNGTLNPGGKTSAARWEMKDYQAPEDFISDDHYNGKITLVKYTIDHDWVKTIRMKYRPSTNF